METIFRLGILLDVVDRITAPMKNIGGAIDGVRAKANALGPVFDKMQTYGKHVAAAGALIIAVLAGTVLASAGTQKALGELASVGVTDMAVMESAAASFSNQWSGTSKAQFIAAAYDIKSGISSLTDQGVADYTRLAALTGKATKSTTAEMTSLFATGFGIYKDMYANLSDLQFGEVFSAGIAASVKQFKTTGSGMAQAISTLGATATTANRPLEEQLAILGMLQATMSGSEAGTKYRAVMMSAAGAGQKLGISLTDANNQLLSMPEILTSLQGKFGSTLDAAEKIKIQQAFGTQEAVAVIDLLYGKVGALTDNIQALGVAQRSGTLTAEQMALAMNQDIGAGIALLWQRVQNLAETIGKQLIPVLAPLFSWVGRVIVALQQFAEHHSTLTRIMVVGTAIVAGLAFVLGGLAFVFGTIGLAVPAVAAGLLDVGKAALWLRGGLIKLLPAVWGFTTALLANPITWIVLGVVALVAGLVLLYKNFAGVREVVDGCLYALGYLAGMAFRFAQAWLTYLLNPLALVRDAFGLITSLLDGIDWSESGRRIVGTLVAGMKAMIMAPVNLVQAGFEKIRALLPFSDAKEGPLSALTLSGARIMETLGAGIAGAAPGLHRTMAGALAGAALTTQIAMAPMSMPGPMVDGGMAAERVSVPNRGPGQTIKKIVIERLEVSLPGVSDGDGFVRELQRLVEGYDV